MIASTPSIAATTNATAPPLVSTLSPSAASSPIRIAAPAPMMTPSMICAATRLIQLASCGRPGRPAGPAPNCGAGPPAPGGAGVV